MNKDLAAVLMTNLIKNAIVHGAKGGPVEVVIASDSISVKNFGGDVALDRALLFERFKKNSSDKGSTGLGLAISKAIADKYKLQLVYNYSDGHEFRLRFPIG